MCVCRAHNDPTAQCSCTCYEHASLLSYQTHLMNEAKDNMPKEDLDVLNDMRSDLLRQWIIEKMLDNNVLAEFNDIVTVVDWADEFEQYILKGHKKEDDNV